MITAHPGQRKIRQDNVVHLKNPHINFGLIRCIISDIVGWMQHRERGEAIVRYSY
jgi:hypothetical protein